MKLIDYIQGKRRGQEANRLEREAMNDPFLQDAIDGFDRILLRQDSMFRRNDCCIF